MKRAYTELRDGFVLFAIATGRVNILSRRSRQACKFLSSQEGCVALYQDPATGFLLWFYDTESNAKRVKNQGEQLGIYFGNNISRFIVDKDGIPQLDEEYIK